MEVKKSSKYKIVEIEFSVLAALVLIVKSLFFIIFSSFVTWLTLYNPADLVGDLTYNGRILIATISTFFTIFYYFFPTILASNINVNLENRGATALLFDYTIGVFLKYGLAVIFIPFNYLIIKIFHRNESSLRYGWTFFDVVESYFHDAKVDSNYEKTRMDVFGTAKRIQHPHLMWIFLLNLFLGITFIFYIIALVWATNPKKAKVQLGDSEESTYLTDDFEKLNRIDKKNMKRLYPDDYTEDEEEYTDSDKKNNYKSFADYNAQEPVALIIDDEQEEKPANNTNVDSYELNGEESLKLRLEKIEKLYRQGILSEDEYQEQRKRILSEI